MKGHQDFPICRNKGACRFSQFSEWGAPRKHRRFKKKIIGGGGGIQISSTHGQGCPAFDFDEIA